MSSKVEMDFMLPSHLNATAPAERRGIRRDHVKMLVMDRYTSKIKHDTFHHLEQYLLPGDVLALNTSRTLPAILKTLDKKEIRLARRVDSSTWDVLIVDGGVEIGDVLPFSEDLSGTVLENQCNGPLTRLTFTKEGIDLLEAIYAMGEPVRYEYISQPWGLEYYQTVFADKPGSVEMPSAGRALSWEMLKSLEESGVKVIPMQLHTGLSYYLDDKWEHSPEENWEEYHIPNETMDEIIQAKAKGKRIIAVGTTVVRALESATKTEVLTGWTNLYVSKDFSLQIVDGIITGMHEPKASHLDMLSAFVDPEQLMEAYQVAINMGYLWHEFGDMNLIL